MKLENELTMTTNPSIWRIEGNELVEQPTMKEPKTSDFYGRKFSTDMDSVDYRSFNEAVSQYKKHLASLRRYPHNLPDSLKGKDLREGEHFRLEDQHWTGSAWWPNIHLVDQKPKPGTKTRIIALPISQPEQPKEFLGKTDDLLDCPFCGGRPEWINLEHPCGVPALQCPECQFSMQQDRRDKTWFYWNRRPKNNSEQPISEEGKDKKYWRDRWFYIIGHNPGRSVNHIEDLIEEMMNYYSPSPSQEAIEVLDWIAYQHDKEKGFLFTLIDGNYYYTDDDEGDNPMDGKELYQLYTEHKKSKQ